MALEQEFVELELSQLHREAAILKAEGWRFIQTHAVNGADGIDLYYSFMKDGLARNYKVAGVKKDMPVPSITDLFLAAFVFENEARELFGVDMRDIVLDFQGAMYAPAVDEPMTYISPEQMAAREKAAKAAAKAAQAESSSGDSVQYGRIPGRALVLTPELIARIEANMAEMPPEKAAKVKAALDARKAEAVAAAQGEVKAEEPQAVESVQAEASADTKAPAAPAVTTKAVDEELERKIAALDPEKAAKVRAALGKGEAVAAVADESASAENAAVLDAELESKLALMDEAAAAKVRAALASRAGKGGN